MEKKKNQILITLDSCRWDTFKNSNLPFLKSGKHERAWAQATYTLPAHVSMFVGKLPHNFSQHEDFDTMASSGRKGKVKQQHWRLVNSEAPRDGVFKLKGQTIRHGFQNQGYVTIGTGAMGWFDPQSSCTNALTESGWSHYRYFRNQGKFNNGTNIKAQTEWALKVIRNTTKPYFLFINAGETHHPYTAKGHNLSGAWGKRNRCEKAQKASLEYIDNMLGTMFANLSDYNAIICGDHGDAWGEDGLWGHSFYHPKVMEVPMVTKVG